MIGLYNEHYTTIQLLLRYYLNIEIRDISILSDMTWVVYTGAIYQRNNIYNTYLDNI